MRLSQREIFFQIAGLLTYVPYTQEAAQVEQRITYSTSFGAKKKYSYKK